MLPSPPVQGRACILARRRGTWRKACLARCQFCLDCALPPLCLHQPVPQPYPYPRERRKSPKARRRSKRRSIAGTTITGVITTLIAGIATLTTVRPAMAAAARGGMSAPAAGVGVAMATAVACGGTAAELGARRAAARHRARLGFAEAICVRGPSVFLSRSS